MTAFWIAAFLFAIAFLGQRPELWALAHADPRLFWAGGTFFVLLGFFHVFAARLPFARKRTPSRLVGLLGREAPLAILFRRPTSVALPLLALASAGLLYGLRMGLFLPPPEGLGDSLLLLEHVPVYTRVFGYLDSFDELLALFFRSRLYLLGADGFGWPVHETYALFSSALGGLYVLLVLFFLKGRSYFATLCGLALFLFIPAIQLYAGYVENYTLASLLLSCALFLSGRALEAKTKGDGFPPGRTVALLAALAATGILVHGVVAFLGPALVYFAFRAAKGEPGPFLGLAARAVVVAGAIIAPVWIYFFFFAGNTVDFFESFAYRPALYPPGRWFSAEHLFGLVNLPLLAAPSALLLLLLAPIIARPGSQSQSVNETGGNRFNKILARLLPRPAERFFLLATLGFAGHAFVWNPLIGFPADWDLFTFFQGPLHCFVFYRLILPLDEERSAATPDRSFSPAILLGLLFVSSATTGFWIARNAERSPQSQANLERTRANADRFLDAIRADERFAALPESRRRKQYVKALLFVLRSREVLEDNPGPEATRIAEDLERSFERCARVLLLKRDEYQREFPPAWQDLTRVNFEIQAWKKRHGILRK